MIQYISTDHLPKKGLQIRIECESEEIETLLVKMYNLGVVRFLDTDCSQCGTHFYEIGETFSMTCEGCRNFFCGNCMKVWHSQKNACGKCLKEMESAHAERLQKKKELYRNRIYLNVPEDEAEDAEELGAKWDSKAKSWYIDSPENEAFELYGPKKVNILSLLGEELD